MFYKARINTKCNFRRMFANKGSVRKCMRTEIIDSQSKENNLLNLLRVSKIFYLGLIFLSFQ